MLQQLGRGSGCSRLPARCRMHSLSCLSLHQSATYKDSSCSCSSSSSRRWRIRTSRVLRCRLTLRCHLPSSACCGAGQRSQVLQQRRRPLLTPCRLRRSLALNHQVPACMICRIPLLLLLLLLPRRAAAGGVPRGSGRPGPPGQHRRDRVHVLTLRSVGAQVALTVMRMRARQHSRCCGSLSGGTGLPWCPMHQRQQQRQRQRRKGSGPPAKARKGREGRAPARQRLRWQQLQVPALLVQTGLSRLRLRAAAAQPAPAQWPSCFSSVSSSRATVVASNAPCCGARGWQLPPLLQQRWVCRTTAGAGMRSAMPYRTA